MLVMGGLEKHTRDKNERLIMDIISYSKDEVIKCLNIGLLCVQEDPVDRPTIESIILMLNSYSVPLPSPQEPAYFFSSVGEHAKHAIKRERVRSI
jgi:hypothetical protein